MKKKRMMLLGLVSACLVLSLFTLPAFAQQIEWNGKLLDASEVPNEVVSQAVVQGDNSPNLDWGTDDWITLQLDACDAFNRESTHTYEALNCILIRPISSETSTSLAFPVHIPSGASLQYIRMYYYDNTTTSISAALYRKDEYGTDALVVGLTPPAFSGGDNMYQTPQFSETISNAPATGYSYYILAIPHRTPTTYEGIYKFVLYYKLQISPAPGFATFSDVPVGSFWHQYVEALVDSGITTGYGDGTFRPDNLVTRGQMAAFLARALGLHWQY